MNTNSCTRDRWSESSSSGRCSGSRRNGSREERLFSILSLSTECYVLRRHRLVADGAFPLFIVFVRPPRRGAAYHSTKRELSKRYCTQQESAPLQPIVRRNERPVAQLEESDVLLVPIVIVVLLPPLSVTALVPAQALVDSKHCASTISFRPYPCRKNQSDFRLVCPESPSGSCRFSHGQ